MENQPENTLSVVACDSGSDKSFDLLGAAKIITCVKELILSVWDRAVFFREKQVAQRLELMTQSLPILEKVSVLEREGHLAPEQAELVRRGVSEGLRQFLACGAVIPEMVGSSHFEPRQLMAAEPKLLTVGSGVDDANADALTDDEQAELDRLQRKATKRRTTRPS